MKPLATIGNWRIYRMNGEIVAIDNRGTYQKFQSVEQALEALGK